jgi:hypothetical protein
MGELRLGGMCRLRDVGTGGVCASTPSLLTAPTLEPRLEKPPQSLRGELQPTATAASIR